MVEPKRLFQDGRRRKTGDILNIDFLRVSLVARAALSTSVLEALALSSLLEQMLVWPVPLSLTSTLTSVLTSILGASSGQDPSSSFPGMACSLVQAVQAVQAAEAVVAVVC